MGQDACMYWVKTSLVMDQGGSLIFFGAFQESCRSHKFSTRFGNKIPNKKYKGKAFHYVYTSDQLQFLHRQRYTVMTY